MHIVIKQKSVPVPPLNPPYGVSIENLVVIKSEESISKMYYTTSVTNHLVEYDFIQDNSLVLEQKNYAKLCPSKDFQKLFVVYYEIIEEERIHSRKNRDHWYIQDYQTKEIVFKCPISGYCESDYYHAKGYFVYNEGTDVIVVDTVKEKVVMREPLLKAKGNSYYSPNGITFAKDGKNIVITTSDMKGFIFDIERAETLYSFKGKYLKKPVVTPSGDQVVIGMGNGYIKVIDLKTYDEEDIRLYLTNKSLLSIWLTEENIMTESPEGNIDIWQVKYDERHSISKHPAKSTFNYSTPFDPFLMLQERIQVALLNSSRQPVEEQNENEKSSHSDEWNKSEEDLKKLLSLVKEMHRLSKKDPRDSGDELHEYLEYKDDGFLEELVHDVYKDFLELNTINPKDKKRPITFQDYAMGFAIDTYSYYIPNPVTNGKETLDYTSQQGMREMGMDPNKVYTAQLDPKTGGLIWTEEEKRDDED